MRLKFGNLDFASSPAARDLTRVATQAIKAVTPLPADTVERALQALDTLDCIHAEQSSSERGQRAERQIESMLRALGLKPDDPIYYTNDGDDDYSAYSTACREARAILASDVLERITAGISALDRDADKRRAARAALRSAIRRKAVDDLQGRKALAAAAAGDPSHMAERLERQRQAVEVESLPDLLAAFDVTYRT